MWHGVIMLLVYVFTLIALLFALLLGFSARKVYPGVTKMQRRSFALLVACCGLLVCLPYALLVWPTEWRYHSQQGREFRTHRWTGETERLTLGGWVRTDK